VQIPITYSGYEPRGIPTPHTIATLHYGLHSFTYVDIYPTPHGPTVHLRMTLLLPRTRLFPILPCGPVRPLPIYLPGSCCAPRICWTPFVTVVHHGCYIVTFTLTVHTGPVTVICHLHSPFTFPPHGLPNRLRTPLQFICYTIYVHTVFTVYVQTDPAPHIP